MKYRNRASLGLWTTTAALTFAGLGLGCGSDEASQPAASPSAAKPADSAAASPSPSPSHTATPAARPTPGRRLVEVENTAGALIDAEIVEGDLPSGFPSDVPTYPGASAATSMAVPGQGTLATFTSASSSQEILDFYRGELESRGWTVSDAKRGGINARKGGRAAQIKVMRTGGQSEIAVNLFDG